MNAPDTNPAVPPQAKTVLVAITHEDGQLIMTVGGQPSLLRKADTHAQLLAVVTDPKTPAAKTTPSLSIGDTIRDVAMILAGGGERPEGT